jgi:hypothetical protein
MEKKPTYKSTTFLLVVVTQALSVMAAIAQYIPAQTAAIIAAVLTGVFAGLNAWIKVNNAETIHALPELNDIKLPEEPPKPNM